MKGTVFSSSPNGYTDRELGFKWVTRVLYGQSKGILRTGRALVLSETVVAK
jgi:hypothetical protein